MALPTPPYYTNPIPNSPFYSAPSYYIQGALGPLIVGSGLSIDYANGIINSSGGGGGGVTSAVAGPGIGVSSATGAVTFTNTGVRSLTAGAGISLSGSTGAVTVTATTLGTVTGILTGAGLTGGPITTSGTIALATSGVTAGSYTNPTVTIDAYGRVTAAASNTVVNSVSVTAPLTITGTNNPTIGIPPSSTTAVGAVQLSDAVNDAASVCAASTAAVKTAYDVAVQAIPKTCITAKGTLITGTAASTPIALPVGTDGQVLAACSTAASGLCWVAVGGGTGTVTSVATGTGLTGGPITSSGTIALANTAVTPGSYTFASFTVDAQGRLTAAGNGTIPVATSSVRGIVYGQTGFSNTLLGQLSGFLIQNCSGCAVTAVGYCAGNLLNTGSIGSTALGAGTLAASTCSRLVTAIGDRAMGEAGNTVENVAVGTLALRAVTGCYNTALGAVAGYDLLAGNSNVLIGHNVACANTAGDRNVVIGPDVTTSSLTVSCELAIGYDAGQNWLTGNNTKAIQPGAGIIDSTNSCGTSNMVLTSQGNAILWKTVSSAIAAPNYGSFYDTTDQINTINTGSGRAVTLDSVDIANNFSVVGGSQITATAAGVYNLQFSLQFETATASLQTMEVWLVKNGVAVPQTNTRFTAKGSNESYFAALNYLVQMSAGDNVELFWASGDVNMILSSTSSIYGGPAIPSAIVTIVPVGA